MEKTVGMKMAKADAKDIDAAGDLMCLLNQIDSGYYPSDDDEEDAPMFFDEDDPKHLRSFYDKTKATMEKAPGYHGRVIGGMCYVILYDKNEIVDPDADVLDLHPKLKEGMDAAEKLRQIMEIAEKSDFKSISLLKLREIVCPEWKVKS